MKKKNIFLVALLVLSLCQQAFGMNQRFYYNKTGWANERFHARCGIYNEWDWEIDWHRRLELAIEAGNSDSVDVILKKPRVNPNEMIPNQSYRSLFCIALQKCWLTRGSQSSYTILKLFLKHPKLKPNMITMGKSPLLWAVWWGQDVAMGLLLDHPKIDPNEGDNNGSPLHWAVVWLNLDAIKLLLNHSGTNQNKKSSNGSTPLHWATLSSVRQGHAQGCKLVNNEVIKMLVRSTGVDLEATIDNPGSENHGKKAYRSQEELEEWKKMREQGLEDLRERVGFLWSNQEKFVFSTDTSRRVRLGGKNLGNVFITFLTQ